VSSPRRVGLPATLKLRHDTHFVDQLGRPAGAPIGRQVPVEEIVTNPNQPRRDLGDLDELAASIREKGVLEPILVRPHGGRYQIVAGERRYRAALEAGLDEVPCVVRPTTDAEAMELALIENLQRQDLSPFEEADGLRSLSGHFGYTHEMLAEKLGKSRSSITETLALSAIPEPVRESCRRADISSKSLLLQIVRQSDPEKMRALVERLRGTSLRRQEVRELAHRARGKARRGRPKGYVFRYQPSGKGFSLTVKFGRAEASRDEVIAALKRALDELSATGDTGLATPQV
jgi:ParB family transcriptional regulator, chromosome partitioning protein